MENPVAESNNATAVPPQTAPPAQGLQLEEALLKQIEYYFSRQNLATDAFLVSQMDADMWVPLDVIAKFKKVSMLTTDTDYIIRVMTSSPNVTVDNQKKMIKPSWKLERNTIILRDIPSDAPQDEVRALFGDKFKITNVHSDVGNTWFVTFDHEDTTIDAMLFVRDQKFRGQDVKARVKSEHLLKTSYTPVAAPQEAYGYYPQRGQYPAYSQYPQQGQYWQQGGYDGQRPYRGGPRSQNYAGGQSTYKEGRKSGVQAAQAAQGGNPAQSGGPPPRGGGDKSSKSRKPKKTVEIKSPNESVPQMTSQHFPPLGRQRAGSFKTGYSKDFKKYSRDEIVNVIQSVTDVSNSELLPAAKESGVFSSAPNTGLEITNAPAVPTPAEAPQPQQQPNPEWPEIASQVGNKQQPTPGEVAQNPRLEAIEKSTQTSAPSSPSVSSVKSIPKVPSYAEIALAAPVRTSSPPIPAQQAPSSPPSKDSA